MPELELEQPSIDVTFDIGEPQDIIIGLLEGLKDFAKSTASTLLNLTVENAYLLFAVVIVSTVAVKVWRTL